MKLPPDDERTEDARAVMATAAMFEKTKLFVGELTWLATILMRFVPVRAPVTARPSVAAICVLLLIT
jgi:hypothetical protein